MSAAATFWATVFGATVGVAAGAVIQFFGTLLLSQYFKSKQKQNLASELRFNRFVLSQILTEAVRLRSAVDGGNVRNYTGIIRASSGLFLVTNQMAQQGTLYEIFDDTDISKLQRATAGLSLGNEQWIMSQIHRLKTDANATDGPEIVNYVDHQFRTMETEITELLRKVDPKS